MWDLRFRMLGLGGLYKLYRLKVLMVPRILTVHAWGVHDVQGAQGLRRRNSGCCITLYTMMPSHEKGLSDKLLAQGSMADMIPLDATAASSRTVTNTGTARGVRNGMTHRGTRLLACVTQSQHHQTHHHPRTVSQGVDSSQRARRKGEEGVRCGRGFRERAPGVRCCSRECELA